MPVKVNGEEAGISWKNLSNPEESPGAFEGLACPRWSQSSQALTSTCQMLAVATQEGTTSGLAALFPRQPAALIPTIPTAGLQSHAQRVSWISHLTLSLHSFSLLSFPHLFFLLVRILGKEHTEGSWCAASHQWVTLSATYGSFSSLPETGLLAKPVMTGPDST